MSELTFKQKIIAIQAELKAPKNQYNNFGKYNYRSCEDILEAVKPLLKKYDLLQTIRDEVVPVGDRIYLKACVIVSGDAENDTCYVEAFAREPENKKGMDESQITGTASSYARKYALNGMWLIDDSKDSDVHESGKPVLEPGTERWKNGIKAFTNGKVDVEAIKENYEITEDNLEKFLDEAMQ